MNVTGCLVEGRACNSHYFMNWRVCWLYGFNRLEPAMLWSTYYWEKSLYTLPQSSTLKILHSLMAGFTVSKSKYCHVQNLSGKCKRVDSSTVEKWRKEQLLEITTNLKTFIMLMRLGCSSGFHLTRQWMFKVFPAMVEEFHGQGNSSVSPQCQWDWRTLTIILMLFMSMQ